MEGKTNLREISDYVIQRAEAIEDEITGIIDNELDEEDFDILMNGIMDHTRPEVIAAFFVAKYYLDDEEKDEIIDAIESESIILAERTKKNNHYSDGINVELLRNIFLKRKYTKYDSENDGGDNGGNDGGDDGDDDDNDDDDWEEDDDDWEDDDEDYLEDDSKD
jgi:hypothetical protein